MRGDFLLPFVETIARNTELASNLGCGTLPRIQQLNGLTLKFRSEPSALSHVPTSAEASSCPLLRCPSNPGQLRLLFG